MRILPFAGTDSAGRPAHRRYGVAVICTAVSVALTVVLSRFLDGEDPLLALFPAIAISTFYGGYLPGLLTTALSAPAALFVVWPDESLKPAGSIVWLQLALFVAFGILISYSINAIFRKERRLSGILDSVSNGFMVFDRDWRYSYLNSGALEMMRRPRQRLLGKPIWEEFPDLVNTEFHHKLHQVALERRPLQFEYFYPPWRASYLFAVYSSPEGVVLVTHENTPATSSATKVEQAQEEATRVNAELEQRVEERTAQLNSTIRELEAFSYSISHDLRAPLRAIDGFSKMLYEDYYARLDDEGKRVIDIIRNNTLNMGRLIDGLLAFSRLGRQALGQSRLSMSEIAHDAVEEVRAQSDARNVEFRVSELPDAVGDRVLLRQVWINILSNAVKFTRGRNPSIIEIAWKPDRENNIFFVRDNGVGFDAKYADKMFGVFQRLHAATEFEGTGLGLAIVQRIVHRHGGRVWAEGVVGSGATIYFSLPNVNGAFNS
jgi:K+-sensing histidine kinase KdpD